MDELLTPRVGLAGKVQQKHKGQEACLEIAGKHTKFAVVFFFNSASCLRMTYFLIFHKSRCNGSESYLLNL